jgi:exportin-T
MGVGGDVVDQYLRTLAGAFEGAKKEKEWRSYFAQFVERAMSGRT